MGHHEVITFSGKSQKNSWGPMGTHGDPWKKTHEISHGASWVFMGPHDNNLMVSHAYSWGSMSYHEKTLMGLRGSSWVFMGLHGASWGLVGLHGPP